MCQQTPWSTVDRPLSWEIDSGNIWLPNKRPQGIRTHVIILFIYVMYSITSCKPPHAPLMLCMCDCCDWWCVKKISTMRPDFWCPRAPPPPLHSLPWGNQDTTTFTFLLHTFIYFQIWFHSLRVCYWNEHTARTRDRLPPARHSWLRKNLEGDRITSFLFALYFHIDEFH